MSVKYVCRGVQIVTAKIINQQPLLTSVENFTAVEIGSSPFKIKTTTTTTTSQSTTSIFHIYSFHCNDITLVIN